MRSKEGKRLKKTIRIKGRDKINFRKLKAEGAELRESKLIKAAELLKKEKQQEKQPSKVENVLPYTISIAIPGSFLNNAQSAELRTYMAGQVARAATLFCVETIIIYDDTSKITKENVDAYYSGNWHCDVAPSSSNFESCFHLAKILEYLECPQYLRKQLFPVQRALKYAGLLNPLDAHHHLKSSDLSIKFREGVVLDKAYKEGLGPICDIGLDKELQIQDAISLPPATRVTVEVSDFNTTEKRFRGKLTSAKKVRAATGLYWGYSVKLAISLQEVLDSKGYDLIIATSPRGKPVADMQACTLTPLKLLVVFGGVDGVDAALEAEEAGAHSAEEAFDRLISSLPNKGTSSERIEENVLVTLSELSMRMDQLCK